MASIDERLEKLKKQKEESFSTESKCGTEETHETID